MPGGIAGVQRLRLGAGFANLVLTVRYEVPLGRRVLTTEPRQFALGKRALLPLPNRTGGREKHGPGLERLTSSAANLVWIKGIA